MEIRQMMEQNKILNHSVANVSYKMPPKDVHIPIPGAREYVTGPNRIEGADGIRLLISGP